MSSGDTASSPSLPDDLVSSFYEWYKEHTPDLDNCSPSKRDDLVCNTPAASRSNGHIRFVGHGRVTFDPVSEIPLLECWLAEDDHPSQADMASFARMLNSRQYRRAPNRPVDLQSISHWFRAARAAKSPSKSDQCFSTEEPPPQKSDLDNRLACESKTTEKLQNGHGDNDSDRVSNEGHAVVKPEADMVPNKIDSNGGSASEFGGTPVSEGHGWGTSCSSEPIVSFENSDENGPDVVRSRDRLTDLGCDTSRRKRRRTSWMSDENHNQRCNSATSSSSLSTGDDEVATDLSLRSTVTVASADCLQPMNSSSSSASTELMSRNVSKHLNTVVKRESDGLMLHAAMARSMASPCQTAGPSHYSFSPLLPQALQHQMQMAVITQAAMRYMQPLYGSIASVNPMTSGIGHNSSSSSFYPLGAKSYTDDDIKYDSSSSTNGEASFGSVAGADCRRKRSRVFIDPLSEIPRLEQWFSTDSHPSAGTIEQLTDELNRSTYRQRFPKLEPKNIQLWFKNHRAKVKRQSIEGSPTIGLPAMMSSAEMPFMDNMFTMNKEEANMSV